MKYTGVSPSLGSLVAKFLFVMCICMYVCMYVCMVGLPVDGASLCICLVKYMAIIRIIGSSLPS